MTTEIAIMNRSALALAADSVATIIFTDPQSNGHRMYNSANKLFALSKYHAVGIMTYGNASLMEIPWEMIIKVYRASLGDRKFDYLKDYSDHFFKFLAKFDVGKDTEKRYVKETATNVFSFIRHELEEFVEKNAKQGKSLSENDINKEFHNIINEHHGRLKSISKKSVLSPQKRTALKKLYSRLINEVMENVFEKRPLSASYRAKLKSAVINAASVGPQNQSEIVIAGFGEKEIFPVCYDFDVAAVFAGHTIKRNKGKNQITHDNNAVVIPFAESDEICTFMEGMGSFVNEFFIDTFGSIMMKLFPQDIASAIGGKFKLNDKQKKQVQNIVAKIGTKAFDDIVEGLDHLKHEKYIQPIVQTTGFRNKDELAKMAETFVNLILLRKQANLEAEMTGGPIDVAVITKGDGFKWIKHHQHHFDTSLEPPIF